MKTIPHKDIIARWTDPNARPLFKGSLIDDSGCCCAQGDILRTYCNYSDQMLRDLSQTKADKEVAERLGITTFQSVLLRIVNDREDGCPQDVLTNPEKFIGDQAPIMLAFARHLDRMTPEQRAATGDATRDAAWDAAWAAAWDDAWAAVWAATGTAAGTAAWDAARDATGAAARDAAWAAAWDDAWAAVWDAAWAARYAMNEIQGAAIMRAKGTPFYFLPIFGFADPEAVMVEDAKRQTK